MITTAPRVTGRSGNVWIDTASDRISTGAPVPGDVGGTVPATLVAHARRAGDVRAVRARASRATTRRTTTATVTSTAGEAALTVARSRAT